MISEAGMSRSPVWKQRSEELGSDPVTPRVLIPRWPRCHKVKGYVMFDLAFALAPEAMRPKQRVTEVRKGRKPTASTTAMPLLSMKKGSGIRGMVMLASESVPFAVSVWITSSQVLREFPATLLTTQT